MSWRLIQGCSLPLTLMQMREAPAPCIKAVIGWVKKKKFPVVIELKELMFFLRLSCDFFLLFLWSLCATLKPQMPSMRRLWRRSLLQLMAAVSLLERSAIVTAELRTQHGNKPSHKARRRLPKINCRAHSWSVSCPPSVCFTRIRSSVCSLMVKVWEMGFGTYLRATDAWVNTKHMATDGTGELQAFSGWCAVSWRWWGCVTHSIWDLLHFSSLVLL